MPNLKVVHAPSRFRARYFHLTSSSQRSFSGFALQLGAALLFGSTGPVAAQNAGQPAQGPEPLGPVVVSPPKPPPGITSPSNQGPKSAPKRTAQRAARPTGQPVPQAAGNAGQLTTPLNSSVVAPSASLLGLTVFQTPASVEVVDQQTMRDRGYRTTPETVQGAVGVLAVDVAGAPAGFSMRGFSLAR